MMLRSRTISGLLRGLTLSWLAFAGACVAGGEASVDGEGSRPMLRLIEPSGGPAEGESMPGALAVEPVLVPENASLRLIDDSIVGLGELGLGRTVVVLDLRDDDGSGGPAVGDIYHRGPQWSQAVDAAIARWLRNHDPDQLQVVSVYAQWRALHALPQGSPPHHARAFDAKAALALRMGVDQLPSLWLVARDGSVRFGLSSLEPLAPFEAALHGLLAPSGLAADHCSSASLSPQN